MSEESNSIVVPDTKPRLTGLEYYLQSNKGSESNNDYPQSLTNRRKATASRHKKCRVQSVLDIRDLYTLISNPS